MAIRDDFFTALANGAKWDVGVSINRTNPLPLDANSVFKTKAELDTYAAGVLAYVGQPVAVVSENDTTLYVLDQNKVPQEVGKATLGDDKSISLDSATGILKIVGFDSAEEGSQLVRTKDGVAWVKPDTSTAEGQATAIAALQTAVGSAAAGDKPATGLIKDVSDNAAAIAANTAAINILNGTAEIEGSVAYQIAQIVEANGDGIDTLKEIAQWIADHPNDVAEMNTSIAANTSAISALQLLVGSESVATQIATKIAEAIKIDGVDKYALASDLSALAGRVGTVESKVSTIESQLLADPLHTHANKTELDKVVSGDVAKWNEAATKADEVKTAITTTPLHTHGNKGVLDTITTETVAAWNSAETNSKSYTETYAATKAQGDLADSALQNVTILGKNLSKAGEKAITADEAKAALGLKSAAYSEASSFETAGAAKLVQGDTTHTVADVYTLASGKTTLEDVNNAIANAGHALASDLTAHISNNSIHVSTAEKQIWNAAVAKLEDLTGEDLSGSGSSTGGIAAMIDTAIDTYDAETVQPAISGINTKLTDILGSGGESKGRLGAVEKLASETAASLSTLDKTVTGDGGHGERIAAAESAISTLQSDSATHATKTELTNGLATKADKEAYEATAETVEELKTTVDAFFKKDAAIEGAIDTLKEIATYIENDTTGATEIASRIGAIESVIGKEASGDEEATGLIKKINKNAADISAEAATREEEDGKLEVRIKKLEDNEYNHATVTQMNEAKAAAISEAEKDAAAKVKALADGAVTTNTDNIAINTADISDLKEDKADKGESYLKAETYTKTEVDALIEAGSAWGSF